MRKVFQSYTDPQHGWAAIPIKTLAQLRLKPSDFSVYSYRRGDTVYLEEDSDLTTFVTAFYQRTGKHPTFHNRHTNKRSRIRGYSRIYD